jgi:ribonuclease D
MIVDQQDLHDLVARARQAELVAVDTEFVWERTYYPRLGVVQIGLGPDDVHLLDAARLDLTPLGALLSDANVTKALHDAGQDLTILRRATGAAPRTIFDTQLAAGFVGIGASVSLQGLIESTVGVRLSKGATRTDWLRRPLSAEQRAYALDDVRYLPEVVATLRQRLAKMGRLPWAEQEMKQYDDPAQYEESVPEERYTAVRGKSKRGFGGREYSVLRELAAWREEEARRRDRPRGHILSDDALLELSQRRPDSLDRLSKMRNLNAREVERYGDAILAGIARGVAVPPEAHPPRADRREEEASLAPRIDLVQALIRGRGQREHLDPALVASRADVERLMADPSPSCDKHAVLCGWRREFIGEDLYALLRGDAAVALDDQGLPAFVRLAPSPG